MLIEQIRIKKVEKVAISTIVQESCEKAYQLNGFFKL